MIITYCMQSEIDIISYLLPIGVFPNHTLNILSAFARRNVQKRSVLTQNGVKIEREKQRTRHTVDKQHTSAIAEVSTR